MGSLILRIARKISDSITSQVNQINEGSSTTFKRPDDAKDRNDFLAIPSVRQYNNFTCGSASLLSILSYYGLFDNKEDELVQMLRTNPIDGTNADQIVNVARHFGLQAERKDGATLEMLQNWLNQKRPVICNFQAWTDDPTIDWSQDEEDGHYAVLIGMDDNYLYFRDPSLNGKIGQLAKSDFMARWHDIDDNQKVDRMCIVFDHHKRPETDDLEYIY